jgi:hypothetical protein
MGFLGTRSSSRQPNGTPATRSLTRDFGQQDKGSTNQKTVTATFTASSARIGGSNGDFANFAIGDRFEIENTVAVPASSMFDTRCRFPSAVPVPRSANIARRSARSREAVRMKSGRRPTSSRPLWLSQGRRAAAPGRLASQRQADRADLDHQSGPVRIKHCPEAVLVGRKA